MIITNLIQLFQRDLKRLIAEIESYPNESDLWFSNEVVKNSSGNLCLHLIGNLNTYIGDGLGNSGYIRDRPLEFSAKNVSREKLTGDLNHTAEMIEEVLSGMSEETLHQEYPQLVLDEKTSVEFFLIHLYGHLNYHLGQISYHRRFVER